MTKTRKTFSPRQIGYILFAFLFFIAMDAYLNRDTTPAPDKALSEALRNDNV